MISPLISLRVVSVIFGALGDWFIYPRELPMMNSSVWVFGWIFVGFCFASLSVRVDNSIREDWVGFNNLCYIRAPYQLFTHSVLFVSLDYLKRVEQGWGEQAGPQGIKSMCIVSSGKRLWFE